MQNRTFQISSNNQLQYSIFHKASSPRKRNFHQRYFQFFFVLRQIDTIAVQGIKKHKKCGMGKERKVPLD